MALLIACRPAKKTNTDENVADKYKVALVSDPIIDDGQFVLQAYNELILLGYKYNLETTYLIVDGAYEWVENTRKLAEQEYDLIIGVGWQAGEAFSILQNAYSDTKFAVIDAIAVDKDVKSILFNTVQGSYILG